MYDVVYLDEHGIESPLVCALADRQEAVVIARSEAARRGAGRMVLTRARSREEHRMCRCVLVVPTDDQR